MDALQPILDATLDGRTKGYPHAQPSLRLGEIGRQGWRLDDLDTPVALLKASALEANEAFMAEFLTKTGASLCPHGKTSMAPQLFRRQLDQGAWGITLATPQQARVARQFGVSRILLANQLVSPGAIEWVQRALDEDPSFDITCLVDSAEGAARLASLARGTRPIPVLLELGIASGRAGARTETEALEAARAIKASARLFLRGVECFEGIVGSQDDAADRARVDAWLGTVGQLARCCVAEDLFGPGEVLLSAGGSAFFDLVATQLRQADLGRPTRVLLRSGCYLFHDVGHYARLQERLERRLKTAARPAGTLRPAIEVWGRVLSRPEPGLAILDFGKRDVGHDIDLPRPLWSWRNLAGQPQPELGGWTITSLYDQHARLSLPVGAALAVGDLVGCGVSHPCTTLDKWPLLWLVDDAYRVVEGIRTFF